MGKGSAPSTGAQPATIRPRRPSPTISHGHGGDYTFGRQKSQSPMSSKLIMELLLLLILFSLSAPLIVVVHSEPSQDRAALLDFIGKVPHERRLRWDNTSSSTCEWIGVTCDANRTSVEALRLPGVGLVGPIPPGTLSRLSGLRVLSLRSNRLSGQIPADFSNLTRLRSLYLQDNRLSGGFPAGIVQLGGILRVDLSSNNLSGEIPFSVNNLTRLTGLFLQRNNFSGRIPSISNPNLVDFNVSYNRLNGSIPTTLNRFSESSFTGNLQLCGAPLPPCTPFFPSPSPSPGTSSNGKKKKKKKLSTGAIVGIAVGSALLLLLLLICCCVFRQRKTSKVPPKGASAEAGMPPRSGETLTSSSISKDEAAAAAAGEGERNRLVFVGKGGGGYSFDLEDLLRASAEVLGKGSVGTSYKAVLEEGTTVVVKRLKDVTASRREFDIHMDALGRVEEHPNLLPLRAYYFSKDEKLLVLDYLPAGSLSSLLHGSRGSGRTPLEWESRLRIGLAAGRGLAHLHSSAKVVHGNIKASNVLLRQDPETATLSDYGLNPLFGSTGPPPSGRLAGYRAPEVVETRRPTFKSDVYSLGVLLLELLTGKAPNQASLGGEEGIDLPRWVQSVVREEWTAEVFDVELMRYPNIEEEMVQLLQIAMACVATVPDARPDIHEVVRMIEDIVRQSEEGPRASSDDPSKVAFAGPTSPSAAPTPTP